MITQPCAPLYEYRPSNFVAGNTKCIAPLYAEHRSRLTTGECFFRSKNQGPDENLISVECGVSTFTVYFDNQVVQTYNISTGIGGISALRVLITNDVDSIIEMPALNYDVHDERATEDDVLIGLVSFPKTSLTGGSGGPTTDAGLSAIRTGPERTIFILSSMESANGSDVTPPASKRIQQWNGTEWISYCNLTAGECPKEGEC